MQGGGDGGIAAGPVGHEESDILFAEGGLDFGFGKHDPFVDLTGEAPGGGEVDEDGAAGGQLAGYFRFRPGEPVRMVKNQVGGGGLESGGRNHRRKKNQG